MDDLTLDELSADAQALYDALPETGGTMSNPQLKKTLAWQDDDRYFTARDEVEDAGLIWRGRGQGGTVARYVESVSSLPDDDVPIPTAPESTLSQVTLERELYEPLRNTIEGAWARDRRMNPIVVEKTANQGSRPTGIWARPDIVSVEVRAFGHVPGKHLRIVTYEVKPSYRIDVQSVYEALAHRRMATESWVLLHIPEEERSRLKESVDAVSSVARAHAIGVITFADASDIDSWEVCETAGHVTPDPEDIEELLGKQLSESARDQIRTAIATS